MPVQGRGRGRGRGRLPNPRPADVDVHMGNEALYVPPVQLPEPVYAPPAAPGFRVARAVKDAKDLGCRVFCEVSGDANAQAWLDQFEQACQSSGWSVL